MADPRPCFVGLWGLSSLKWNKVCPGIGADATKGEMGDHQVSGSFSDADNLFPHPHCPPISFSECKQPENSRPTTDKKLRDWGARSWLLKQCFFSQEKLLNM